MNAASARIPLAHQEAWPTVNHNLVGFVRIAIEEISWDTKSRLFNSKHHMGFRCIDLMTLEVYCYAKGAFESSKVEALCQNDPFLIDLFPEDYPSKQLIRRFRRLHHDPIKACLRKIFDIAFQVRFGSSNEEEAPIDYCVVKSMDEWFEPMCGPRPKVEAEERLDQAIFWDGMATSCDRF